MFQIAAYSFFVRFIFYHPTITNSYSYTHQEFFWQFLLLFDNRFVKCKPTLTFQFSALQLNFNLDASSQIKF